MFIFYRIKTHLPLDLQVTNTNDHENTLTNSTRAASVYQNTQFPSNSGRFALLVPLDVQSMDAKF